MSSFVSTREHSSLPCSTVEFFAHSSDSPDLDIDEGSDEKLYCFVGSHTTDHDDLGSNAAYVERECKYCEDAMEADAVKDA